MQALCKRNGLEQDNKIVRFKYLNILYIINVINRRLKW